jgi:hypothetical protein
MSSVIKIALGVCLGIAGFFIGCFVIGVGMTGAIIENAPALNLPPPAAPIVTNAEYMMLRDGMSYAEACAVIGADGDESSSNFMEGVPGVMEPISTKAFSWVNDDGSNAFLMFQNDKLVSRAQFGLE